MLALTVKFPYINFLDNFITNLYFLYSCVAVGFLGYQINKQE